MGIKAGEVWELEIRRTVAKINKRNIESIKGYFLFVKKLFATDAIAIFIFFLRFLDLGPPKMGSFSLFLNLLTEVLGDGERDLAWEEDAAEGIEILG